MSFMTWWFFALLAGSFYTGTGLVTRHILRGGQDAWAYSFYFSAVGALVSLPFFLWSWQTPSQALGWGLMLTIGCLVVIHNWLNFTSSKYIPASVNGVVLKFRLASVLVLAAVFGQETLTGLKIAGVVCAIAAGWLLRQSFRGSQSLYGLGLAFVSTIVYGTVVTISKFLLTNSFFSSPALTFFIFFGPMVINALIMPSARSRIIALWQVARWRVVLATTLGGLANLSINQAFLLGEASRVVIMVESFLVVTLVGEHFWLREREHLVAKVCAVFISLLGAWLITH